MVEIQFRGVIEGEEKKSRKDATPKGGEFFIFFFYCF